MTSPSAMLTKLELDEIRAVSAVWSKEWQGPYAHVRALLRHIDALSASAAVAGVGEEAPFLPWRAIGTSVYFANVAGGFDVRNCPEPERIARTIVSAVNSSRIQPVATWVEWKFGDVLPMHACYTVTFSDGTLGVLCASDFAQSNMVAYWPIPLPASAPTGQQEKAGE